jgi:hypothetical protein
LDDEGVFIVLKYVENFRLLVMNILKKIQKRNLLFRRNDQQYALIVPLLYSVYWLLHVWASSLPSSGSFLDPSELFEIQIEWVVYHIMCGYLAGV